MKINYQLKILDSFWVTALFWFLKKFIEKFHKNPYISLHFKYFQKPLILQAIQQYSRMTAIYESIWIMDGWWKVGHAAPTKNDIWPQKWFFPQKSIILLWIKKSQQIHRETHIMWNPLLSISVLIEAIGPKLTE